MIKTEKEQQYQFYQLSRKKKLLLVPTKLQLSRLFSVFEKFDRYLYFFHVELVKRQPTLLLCQSQKVEKLGYKHPVHLDLSLDCLPKEIRNK